MGPGRRLLVTQSTQPRSASSWGSACCAKSFGGEPTRFCKGPFMVSARGLSQRSPTLPSDGSMPALANRSLLRRGKYCPPHGPALVCDANDARDGPSDEPIRPSGPVVDHVGLVPRPREQRLSWLTAIPAIRQCDQRTCR